MVIVDKEKCIGCGMCVRDCIALNIKLEDKKAGIKNECFQCGHCVAVCPAGAVSIPDYDMKDVEEYQAESFHLAPEQVLHSIKFRRSIRDYKQEKVKQSDLELLLQAGRYTATAKNNQDCYFAFVQDEVEQLKSIVWDFIEDMEKSEGRKIAKELLPYVAFNRRRKSDPKDDYLFRNAPVVLFITSDWQLDAGLAAQNIETMAVSLGMGALYNGFLARIADENEKLKKWLGIEGKTIKACMLLGYPTRHYVRTAPRQEANVIWK
ncbi:MAG: nitroreductase [Clostridia bacterium]|nr:nitroreductase [Clostridia bacterium]NCC42163.1 nitroreductase [Clostridia bacterium]